MEPLWAKVISLCVICLFTLLCGLLPLKIAPKNNPANRNGKAQRGTLLNVLLSFSGGVLFATCFIHLLPEVSEQFEKAILQRAINRTVVFATGAETAPAVPPKQALPWGEFTVCVGFFIIYALEEVVEHFVCRSCEKQHHHHNETEVKHEDGPKSCLAPVHSIHGAHRDPHDSRDCAESKPEAEAKPVEQAHGDRVPLCDSGKVHYGSCSGEDPADQIGCSSSAAVHLHADTSGSLPDPHESVRAVLRGLMLVCALSFHSLFEGMAIGLQTTSSDVWNTFVGVAIHKFVIAFCVGVELVILKTRTNVFVIYIVAFALMSPSGIGIGALVTETNAGMAQYPLVLATMQGLATGTLLYVTFFEILTKMKGVELSSFMNFSAILVGFACMTAFHLLE